MRAMLMVGLALAWASPALAIDPAAVKELAPTGKLRAGIAVAPAPNAVFAVKEANGDYRGPTVTFSRALAKSLGVEVEFAPRPNTGELTEALAAGTMDVGYMPVDEARRKLLDFSPPYSFASSCYFVRTSSGLKTMADVDKASVKVIAISGTTTLRAVEHNLKTNKVVAVRSVAEAIAMLKSNEAQAFALGRDSLKDLQKEVPDLIALDGAIHRADISIAVRKNHPAALAFVKAFVEDAKKSGAIRRAFDDAGLQGLEVAP
ncbi:MAG TPA: transporter substrate-binding domain-containing protein [Reyranella sp.]|nr:transporter substrate-binding domain-containing protein [Reyranella sp.]